MTFALNYIPTFQKWIPCKLLSNKKIAFHHYPGTKELLKIPGSAPVQYKNFLIIQIFNTSRIVEHIHIHTYTHSTHTQMLIRVDWAVMVLFIRFGSVVSQHTHPDLKLINLCVPFSSFIFPPEKIKQQDNTLFQNISCFGIGWIKLRFFIFGFPSLLEIVEYMSLLYQF